MKETMKTQKLHNLVVVERYGLYQIIKDYQEVVLIVFVGTDFSVIVLIILTLLVVVVIKIAKRQNYLLH